MDGCSGVVVEKDKLNEYVQELFANAGRTFRPMFPWVAVRVMAREQLSSSGLLVLPDKQNKPVLEGIVLRTWAPIHLQIDMVRQENTPDRPNQPSRPPSYLPRVVGKGVPCETCSGAGGWPSGVDPSVAWQECTECSGQGLLFSSGLGRSHVSQLKPGDHVLFPHWAGLPMAGFSSEKYRIVKEEGWTSSSEGGIFATVDYSPVAQRAEALAQDIIRDKFLKHGIKVDKDVLESLVREMGEKLMLVDREGRGVTLSGR